MEVDLRRLLRLIDAKAGYAGGVVGVSDDDDDVGATMTMKMARKAGISSPSYPPFYEMV